MYVFASCQRKAQASRHPGCAKPRPSPPPRKNISLRSRIPYFYFAHLWDTNRTEAALRSFNLVQTQLPGARSACSGGPAAAPVGLGRFQSQAPACRCPPARSPALAGVCQGWVPQAQGRGWKPFVHQVTSRLTDSSPQHGQHFPGFIFFLKLMLISKSLREEPRSRPKTSLMFSRVPTPKRAGKAQRPRTPRTPLGARATPR